MNIQDMVVKIHHMNDKHPGGKWEDVRRNTTCHSFYWVYAGKGAFYSGQKSWRVDEGTLYYLKPGLRLKMVADENDSMQILMVLFDCAEVQNVEGIWSHANPVTDLELPFQTFFEYPVREEIHESFRAFLANWIPGDPDSELSIKLNWFQLLLALKKEIKARTGNPMVETIANIQKEIHEEYGRALKIDELARRYSMSPSCLRKWFTKLTGQSPKGYLDDLRMKQAARFMLHTNDPVKEVAKRCGYRDELYFSKAFRKQYGKSPVQYRNHLKLEI